MILLESFGLGLRGWVGSSQVNLMGVRFGWLQCVQFGWS